MNVVAVQFDIVWENKQANFAKVRGLVKEAAPEKESLVVLPEMFATGFSMNVDNIAEASGGETEQFLTAAAKEFGVYLAGGVAMRGSDGRARNQALVFSPTGERLVLYAKMRPFAPGGEAQHYEAGDRPAVFRWQDCTVAPFICYDLRFPEIFRQAMAVHRPEVFLVIASWPEKRIQHWVRLLQARAIENQAFVIGVNRIGTDPYYTYTGRSIIVDHQGEILADADSREGCVSARLDIAGLRKYRQGLPFLDDMRETAIFPAAVCSVSTL